MVQTYAAEGRLAQLCVVTSKAPRRHSRDAAQMMLHCSYLRTKHGRYVPFRLGASMVRIDCCSGPPRLVRTVFNLSMPRSFDFGSNKHK